MKLVLLTAAAFIAMPAFAQTTPGTMSSDPGQSTTMTPQTGMPPSSTTGDQTMSSGGTTTPPASSNMPMAGDQSMSSGSTSSGQAMPARRRTRRGAASSSGSMSGDGAMAGQPAGATSGQDSSAMGSGAMAGSPSAADSGASYPMCSRTVTDHCMERSNAAGARLHSTPRP